MASKNHSTGSSPETEQRGRQRVRFRLHTVLAAITVLCVFLAIPTVAYVLGLVALWWIPGCGVLSVLLLLQAPLFFWLRRRQMRGPER